MVQDHVTPSAEISSFPVSRDFTDTAIHTSGFTTEALLTFQLDNSLSSGTDYVFIFVTRTVSGCYWHSPDASSTQACACTQAVAATKLSL